MDGACGMLSTEENSYRVLLRKAEGNCFNEREGFDFFTL